MNKRVTHIALLGGLALLFSCKNMPSENRGPIVLGDSSMIVTENDPAKLQDLVTDLNPVIRSSEPKDTPVPAQNTPDPKPADTTKKIAAAPSPKVQAAPTGNGLKADFNIMSLLIPNVVAKQSGNPNLEHANGAVYTLVSGNISGNLIKVTANVTKISQRYQTVVVLKNELGVLPLDALSMTTGWEALKGVNSMYRISGLDEKSLEFSEADRGDIHEAVAKAARRHHMSRKKQQEWEKSVRNVRAANQKPLYVMLRSVMWKIDGKDASGKLFSKQVRIDMPL
jgi:hypothetical protein